jgi:alcohol dehydrogenase (NADP+)
MLIYRSYNGTHKTGDHSYGGYAKYWRGPSHFVIKIPDALSSEEAAPMLCGGITVFNPLSANGCGPGKKVGIVGIGGLGHFGLLFAKALGADKVVAISRGSGKKADALKMGADDFIATAEEEDWGTKHAQSLDLIICTVSSPKMPLQQYLQLLRTNGTFIQVGAPEDPIPAFMAFALIGKGVKIGGSMIGSPDQIRHMLDLAAEKGVHSWTNPRPMSEANKAVVDFEKNPPRYRFVLVN